MAGKDEQFCAEWVLRKPYTMAERWPSSMVSSTDGMMEEVVRADDSSSLVVEWDD